MDLYLINKLIGDKMKENSDEVFNNIIDVCDDLSKIKYSKSLKDKISLFKYRRILKNTIKKNTSDVIIDNEFIFDFCRFAIKVDLDNKIFINNYSYIFCQIGASVYRIIRTNLTDDTLMILTFYKVEDKYSVKYKKSKSAVAEYYENEIPSKISDTFGISNLLKQYVLNYIDATTKY